VGWEPTAHAYNPNYLRSRDQEDYSLRPVRGKKVLFLRLYLKNTQYKTGLAEWLKWESTSLATI
jgi:hypothetical protein